MPLARSFKICLVISAALMAACSQAKTQTVEVTPPDTAVTAQTEWRAKHVDATGASALLASRPDVVVLDVRTPGEIEKGHIQGAVFADFNGSEFKTQLAGLDRRAPYIVHCRSGGRSTKALTTLKEMGFTDITHMDGGIKGWKKADLPLTKS